MKAASQQGIDVMLEIDVMLDPTVAARTPYTAPAIRDYGDLVDVTATIGGGLSDVPQGSPTGTGCQVVADCFS